MNHPERSSPDSVEHVMRLQTEAKRSKDMAAYARSLGRERPAKVAEMVGYYRDEAATRSMERGWLSEPTTDQYSGELRSLNIPQPIGETLILAVNRLHVASAHSKESVKITGPNFQQLPIHSRDGNITSTETGDPYDGRVVDLVKDVFALTGLPYEQNYNAGPVDQVSMNSPFGPEIIYFKLDKEVKLIAKPPSLPWVRPAEVYHPED